MAGLSRVAQGRWVEDQVSLWIEEQGIAIVQRNYRIPGGELDIIASEPEDGTILFIEVRSRGCDQPGLPEETLSASKRGFVRRAATRWLVERGLWERRPVRFDVVAVDTRPCAKSPGLEIIDRRWIRGAFDASGR